MVTTNKPTNGKTNAAEVKDIKTYAAAQAAQTKAPELSNLMVSAPPAPREKKPIKERLNTFFELEKLFKKREQILEALEKLDTFQIGSTGGDNLRLMDAKGTTFAISHPIIIGEMVSMSKQKLNVRH